jgi:hypothetical protein
MIEPYVKHPCSEFEVQMNDHIIIAVYCRLVQQDNCSADDILVSPDLRAEFLNRIRVQNQSLTEKYILQRLIYLRKKGRLPRSRSLSAAGASE